MRTNLPEVCTCVDSVADGFGSDQRGQGMIEYALLIVLVALLVLGSLGFVGTLVGDVMAMVSEVLGSQCQPGLQMVYSGQRFAPGEAQPGEISLAWPASGRISQRAWACHHAIDVAAPIGMPIYAAAAGEVVVAGHTEYPGYGRMVVIRHAGGYQTLYGHLSASYVHAGQHVSQGPGDRTHGQHRSLHRLPSAFRSE